MGIFSHDDLPQSNYHEEWRQHQRLEKLEAFYKAVIELTINHEVVGDHATVSPRKLGEALEKVDSNWWKVN
jgi:hypothetical protein